VLIINASLPGVSGQVHSLYPDERPYRPLILS
jgi:hypothetical protein